MAPEWLVNCNDFSHLLNLNQSREELEDVHGKRDYYAYLRSPEFVEAFLRPLALLLIELGGTVLDVGCGEAILADYMPRDVYFGMDGSAAAIAKAAFRCPRAWLLYGRLESPVLVPKVDTVLFGGIMSVLVKRSVRHIFARTYLAACKARNLVVYDLSSMGWRELTKDFGEPTKKYQAVAMGPAGIEENRRDRTIMVWEGVGCQ